MSDVRMKGGPELMAFLGNFPMKVQRNVMRGALRAAANVVRKDAQMRAPRKSGLLARGLKVSTRSKGGQISAVVRATGPHAFLGKFFEFGVKPHWIMPRDKKKGALLINGHLVSGGVWHPGMRPRPFLRPALDLRAAEAVAAMGSYISARMGKMGFDAPELTVDGVDT